MTYLVSLCGTSYINKLVFGQTRFAATADPIEHISGRKILVTNICKDGDLADLTSPNSFAPLLCQRRSSDAVK